MFSEQQKMTLKDLGYQGLPLENCGAFLGMISSKFIKEYRLDEQAQLAYETGKAEKKLKLLVSLEEKMDEKNDTKATAAMIQIFGLKDDPRKAPIIEDTSNSLLDSDALNPLLILSGDDEEDSPKAKK